MRLKDKADKVLEWAKGWSGFDGYLKLNAIISTEGDATLVTDAVDTADVTYIDGSSDRRFTFTLRLVMPWSDGFDSVNSDSMRRAEELYDWVQSQGEKKNYPEWDVAGFDRLFPVKSYPEMGFVYEEDQLAEYTVDVEIDYRE